MSLGVNEAPLVAVLLVISSMEARLGFGGAVDEPEEHDVSRCQLTSRLNCGYEKRIGFWPGSAFWRFSNSFERGIVCAFVLRRAALTVLVGHVSTFRTGCRSLECADDDDL